MKFTIKDQHNPEVQKFQIVAGSTIHAHGVSQEFAQLFMAMAEALTELQSKDGMCIYGTPELFHAPDEVKKVFRDGSALAFARCAETARVGFGAKMTEQETEVELQVTQ
jgi:hypothetical protein